MIRLFLNLLCIYILFKKSLLYNELEDRDICMKIRQHQLDKRAIPTLVGAGSSSYLDEDMEFEPKLVLHYNFENQKSFIQLNVQDASPFENNGRFGPGGLVLQIPGSSCNNAAYLPCSDITLNGETFQAKPSYGITISAFIMLLDIKGRHNIFETYSLSSPKGQIHFEVDYGILRWSSKGFNGKANFEVAAELVPAKVWTHIAGTYNSTTGIAQLYINGRPINRTIGLIKMSKDWSCLAHIGGGCRNKALMGFIDDVRIYNYGLSSKEVETISTVCSFTDDNSQPQPPSPPSSIIAPQPYEQEEYFIKKSKILSKNKLTDSSILKTESDNTLE